MWPQFTHVVIPKNCSHGLACDDQPSVQLFCLGGSSFQKPWVFESADVPIEHPRLQDWFTDLLQDYVDLKFGRIRSENHIRGS